MRLGFLFHALSGRGQGTRTVSAPVEALYHPTITTGFWVFGLLPQNAGTEMGPTNIMLTGVPLTG